MKVHWGNLEDFVEEARGSLSPQGPKVDDSLISNCFATLSLQSKLLPDRRADLCKSSMHYAVVKPDTYPSYKGPHFKYKTYNVENVHDKEILPS